MTPTTTKQDATGYSTEEQEHNDALKEQHTRHIAYASRFFKLHTN